MSGRRALLLVNRKSRQGQTQLAGVLESLRARGFELLSVAAGPGELGEAIRRHAVRADLVIIGGGDGTLNAAADALAETRLPLGILPLGTANDLARTLGLPTGVAEAAEVIAGGRLHDIDLGRVNGKHFFNVASIGLSVQVTRCLSRAVKRRWGRLGYAVACLDALRSARIFRADIRHDGRQMRLRSIQIAVGNGRHYGGGMTIAEDAAIDDQRLDLYSIAPRSLWQLVLLAPALRRGSHGRFDGVHVLKARRIEIDTGRPMPINTDGELTAWTPAQFELVPAALAVYVPAATPAGTETRHAAQ